MQPVTALRRPTPPAAASTMPPPPPPPSNRPATPLRPPELPLPSALVPPKKRRVFRTPPKATTPLPPPPPPVPVAVGVAGPTPPPPRADHAESPLFSAQKPPPPPPAGKPSSPPPPPPAAEKPPSPPPPPPPAENPSSPPPPPFAEEPSTPPPPPPPPAENPNSPPPPPAGNPSFPPLPPLYAADEKPSAPTPTDAAAEPAPAPKPRKMTRKVRRRVPKGTIAARKAAAEAASAAAGASQLVKGHAPDKSSRNAATDGVVETEQSFGGNTVQKPATSCNPIAAVSETQLGKGTVVCETLLGKGTVGGGTLADKPVTDIGGEHDVEKTLGSRAVDRAEVGMSERQRRRMTEVFVGGLNRDAKEEDVRTALSVAGEITEVRMIMDATVKKNKGYCFVRYREAAQAKKAIARFCNVKICGKQCRVAALGGNDKIFLGNIEKKWKKEDIMKLLQKIGVENIDVVTLPPDSNNPGYNRGFAFLELETYRDTQIAYRKLSRKDVFGKGLNIRVDWAEPLNAPDENQKQQVKTVFVDGVPNSWDQAKLTEIFKKYGKVELVALSRDMHRAKRNDFALVHYYTHEAAILCLESFEGEQLTENGSKGKKNPTWAKSVQKGKNNMEDHKFCTSQKDETKTSKSERKLGPSMSGYKKSSTTHGFVQVLRELAPWRHGHTGSGSLTQNYARILSGEKRHFSALGIDSYSMTRNPDRGHERNTYATSTSSVSPRGVTWYSPPYHHESRRCLLDSDPLLSEPWGEIQMRQACSPKSRTSHDSWH